MAEQYLMGLDVGTAGCKAVVFDIKGKLCGYGFSEYPLICNVPKQAEQDASLVFGRLRAVMKKAVQKSGVKRIEAMGLSIQGDATMPVDRRYRPLHNMLLGMDYRPEEQMAYCKEKLGDFEAFQKTGMPVHPINSIMKVLWLRENRPDIYERSFKFVTYSEYILARLGGEPVIDVSMASRSMGVDVHTRQWSDEVMEKLEIDKSLFCRIVESGTVVGELKRELAEGLGLENRPLLVTGGHDQPLGAIGAGVIEEGMAVDSSGTAEIFSTVFNKPKLNRRMFDSFYPCYRHAVPGLYFTFALNHIGGILLRWYRDNFAYPEILEARRKKQDVYSYIQTKVKPEPSDLLVLPHFNGSGTPTCDMSSKGAIVGLTLAHTRHDIFKAIMDSLSYELRLNIEAMEGAGINIRQIRAVGGGSKSPLWMQIKADITGRPITTVKCKEAGCLGAAVLAAVGVGAYENVAEAVQHMVELESVYNPRAQYTMQYTGRYELYKQLYPSLQKINSGL